MSAEKVLTPTDPRHGTNAGYFAHRNHGLMPACEPCNAAHASYVRANRWHNANSGKYTRSSCRLCGSVFEDHHCVMT